MNILEKQIDRELKKIDPDLFLDKHMFEGHLFWSVRYMAPPGQEPLYVTISPELNWGMVSQVRLNEGDITEAISRVKANNAAKQEAAKQELFDAIDEAAAEHDRSTGRLRRWYIPNTKPI